MTLTLEVANTIIENAFKAAQDNKVNPLGVVVIDASGHIISAQRMDGANFFRVDVALGKAYAAVAMGASSRALLKRAQGNPTFFGNLANTAQGKFLPQTGAALIRDA